MPRTAGTTRARDFLLREAREDHVGLWKVLWIVEDYAGPAPDEFKETVLGVLSDLLEEGLLVAGFPSGRLDFTPWEMPPAEAVARIRREWDELGRDPTIAEIAWFDITDKGRAACQSAP